LQWYCASDKRRKTGGARHHEQQTINEREKREREKEREEREREMQLIQYGHSAAISLKLH
jgi:hypothetical protein